MEQTTIFKKQENLIVEEVDGAYLLMNQSDDGGKGIYISNTAVDIFNLCDGKNTFKDIVDAVMNQYEVDIDTCTKDIETCLELLATENIITKYYR